MSTGSKPPRRMRVWPAIVAPLGLSLLLGVAAWLFVSKVAADQDQANAESLRLESYARLEAGELAGRARGIAVGFVDARMKQRAEQAKNIRVELHGVMEAVYRVLSAGLEKTRSAAAAPRDVGDFPTGFESLRLYLELAGGPSDGDAPVAAMRACLPELSALVPPGCSLTVVENNFEEILSVGGGAAPENARTESLNREFIWGDGDNNRRWTLQVKLSEADAYPMPEAQEVAAHVAERLADVRLEQTTWGGWLVDRSGRAAASFAAAREGGGKSRGGDAPPFLDMPGEWVEIDGRRLVWQERAAVMDALDMAPAVAVAIDRPKPALIWHEELKKDVRWSATLGILALLSLATWAWFFRSLFVAKRASSRRSAAEREIPVAAKSPPPAHAAAQAAAQAALAAARSGAAKGAAAAPRQRLVRDERAPRPVTDVQGVIVADISDDGEVLVEAELQPPRPRPRLIIPSGSLARLQERHRGGKGRQGSRILDHARSQVLRELASRVRPVVGAIPSHMESRRTQRPGRATERIVPSTSASGWDKVGE